MIECERIYQMLQDGKIPIVEGVFVDAFFADCVKGVSGTITTRIGAGKYFVTEIKDVNTDKRSDR